MSKVITANLLARGTVVFRGRDTSWIERIEDAAVYDDAASAEEALAIAQLDEARAIVVDAFIVDQKQGMAGRDAMTLRNAIRAYGPTIDYHPTVRINAV